MANLPDDPDLAVAAGRRLIHDHLPYSELQFFPKLCAFSIGCHEAPKRTIYGLIPPRGYLTEPGFPNHDGDRGHLYEGVPRLVASVATS